MKFFLLLLLFVNFMKPSYSEIMVLSKCNGINDTFLKNEYILNLKKSLMTRNYIYDNKTYKKLRNIDLSIKKKNTIENFIYVEEDIILTDKVGYPLFYTQLLFEKNSSVIKIKTVINNEEALRKVSTCNKVEVFEKES